MDPELAGIIQTEEAPEEQLVVLEESLEGNRCVLETKEDEDEDKTSQDDNDISGLGLPPVNQSKSNNVVPILDRSICLVPVRFQSYRNGSWYDMLPK